MAIAVGPRATGKADLKSRNLGKPTVPFVDEARP
jgi:hypothetical protein